MTAPAIAGNGVLLPDGNWMRGPLLGAQEPRFWTAPPRHRDKDPDCRACQAAPDYACGCGDYQSQDLLGWAEGFGYDLDPWQSWWLTEACGTQPDGRWAAFETMLICTRQNGKNVCLEVRELGGLFLLGESMLIHTAHEFLRLLLSISAASGTPSPPTTSSAAGSSLSPPHTATRRSSSGRCPR